MSPEASSVVESLTVIDGSAASHKKLDDRLTPDQRVELHCWLENCDETYKTAGKRLLHEYGVDGITERQLRAWHQTRKVAAARVNLAQQAEASKELLMAKSDADTVEEAVVAVLINRAMEVVNQPKITPSFYREVVGLVVRLREQKISMERLALERARFELDVAELVMKHIDKLKESGALQIEDRGDAAKRIRAELFGKYSEQQLEAAGLIES